MMQKSDDKWSSDRRNWNLQLKLYIFTQYAYIIYISSLYKYICIKSGGIKELVMW